MTELVWTLSREHVRRHNKMAAATASPFLHAFNTFVNYLSRYVRLGDGDWTLEDHNKADTYEKYQSTICVMPTKLQ